MEIFTSRSISTIPTASSRASQMSRKPSASQAWLFTTVCLTSFPSASQKQQLTLPPAALFSHDGPDPILGFSSDALNTSMTINCSSAVVAMAESIEAFRTLPDSASKTFIYTGNALNTVLIPGMMTFGIAKSMAPCIARVSLTSRLSFNHRSLRSLPNSRSLPSFLPNSLFRHRFQRPYH